MIKKSLALAAAVLFAACCFAGCSSTPDDSASASASAEASSSVSPESSTSASSSAAISPVDLDTEHTIEGLSYKVNSEWTETDAGTMAAYGGTLAGDLPFSITVAALDAELVAAADASETEPNGALLGALGVDSSGLEETDFKGQPAYKFSGEAESAYEATGYTIREDDGTMFILLMLSTNISDSAVQNLWESFIDSVELPAQ